MKVERREKLQQLVTHLQGREVDSSPRSDCPPDHDLDNLDGGDLDTDHLNPVWTHVATCPRCIRYLALRAGELRPHPREDEIIRSALRELRPERRPAGIRVGWIPAVVGASALLALGIVQFNAEEHSPIPALDLTLTGAQSLYQGEEKVDPTVPEFTLDSRISLVVRSSDGLSPLPTGVVPWLYVVWSNGQVDLLQEGENLQVERGPVGLKVSVDVIHLPHLVPGETSLHLLIANPEDLQKLPPPAPGATFTATIQEEISTRRVYHSHRLVVFRAEALVPKP